MHRFFINGATPDSQGRLDISQTAHQLSRVLRLSIGTQIVVLDGTGRAYLTTLETLDAHHATGQVVEQMLMPEPAIHVTLYQCALKADKFEWVLQKGTELGVSEFVPAVSTRTIVRPTTALEKKRTRWEAILREAAEQSRRGRIPALAPAVDWHAALAPGPLQATNMHTLKLLAWEDADAPPGIGEVVHQWRKTHPSLDNQTIACLIGPEGGLTATEVTQAQAAGWQVVALGPRILRAETAALAAVTLIMQACGEFDAPAKK